MLIKVDIVDKEVAYVKMRRHEKRNALSIEMMKEFIHVLNKLDKNEEVRVIVIEGEGPCFCAGLDLTEAVDRAHIDESAELIKELLLIIYSLSKITIASVQGPAIAGGAGLMCVCDVVVATTDSQIGIPELKRGLVPAYIITFLKRRIDEGAIRELVILARTISAQEAKEIGLVHFVIEKNERNQFIQSLIDESLLSAPGAVIHTKNLLEVLHARDIKEELKMAEKVHRLSRDSSEGAEGIKAFFEKRKPKWSL